MTSLRYPEAKKVQNQQLASLHQGAYQSRLADILA
ncbi:Uncharacterised protein [Yersinia intermedia]|jgi:hypothetical protein|nr:Uncharacterised protein [Yersinia kristensenii]VDZ51409.1 Uncharacterised protein [Yersinia intermedia]